MLTIFRDPRGFAHLAAACAALLAAACAAPGDEPEPAAEPDGGTGSAAALFDTHAWKGLLARPIYRAQIMLPSSSGTYHFETTDLKKTDLLNPDTVINVQASMPFPGWPPGEWANDSCDGSGAAACVDVPAIYTTYTVTVFGRWVYMGGTFDLTVNGSVIANDAAFGGALIPISVPPDGSYALQTVHRPRGATDTMLYMYDTNFKQLAFDQNSGIGTAAKLTRTITGTERLLVGSTSLGAMGEDGLVDVYIDSCLDENINCPGENGVRVDGGDPDNDWLSTALENELGTDPDKRDTDEDGIFDYYEVIGRKAGSDELPLPLLGANPRHGDLFLEMDMADTVPAGTTWLNNTIMNGLAAIWNDLPFQNPDGTTGIHVHADGGSCTDPTLCGMWGGAEVISHDCNAVPSTSTVIANMSPARRGIFHYTLRSCGAQGAVNEPICRIGPNNNVNEAEVWSQEIGHGMGLDHTGPYSDPEGTHVNFKANYPSCMNYAYQNQLGPDPTSHFSHGLMDDLDPEAQTEQGYTPGVDKTYMTGWPYNYLVAGDNVDFDRDGRISSQTVMYDPGPFGERLGDWPDIFELGDVGTRIPSGGVGVTVDVIQSGGALSKIFVAAPFTHSSGGVFPEIAWHTHAVGSTPGGWSSWHPAPPLPAGGGDPNGEVATAPLQFQGEPSVFVTMPASDGRLYYSIFKSTSQVWTAWTVMPAWPAGTRARQATVVSVLASIWIVYRDINAADGVPNTWLTRRDSDSAGTFDAWQQLATPSYVTPGLAYGADNRLYMLYMTRNVNGSMIQPRLKLAWRLTSADSTFTDVNQITWPNPGYDGATDIPAAQRTRLQLIGLPYRIHGGAPFSDGSGYLTAYWNSGRLSPSPSQNVQSSWALRRANTPGYIAPGVSCFGATITGGACSANVTAQVRFQTQTDRPWPLYSPAVAKRWHGASAAYVQSVWDNTNPFEPTPRQIGYQPWANGVAWGAPGWYTDNDDAATIREFACTSLWSLVSQTCKCNGGC